MLNKNATRIASKEPFEFFITDNFLDEFIYGRIRKDFYCVINKIGAWKREYGVAYVSDEVLETPILIYGGTSEVDSYSDVYSLFEHHEAFRAFLDRLLDKTFVQDMISPIHLKRVKIHKPTDAVGFFDKIFYNNLTVSIKISRAAPGSGIAIHPDNYPKVISMLLYFGWSDSVERRSLGTQIYKKDKTYPTPIHHCYFSHEMFTLHQDVFPIENRLMGFIAGEQSWHGVDPTSCKEPKDVTRDVLQINLIKHTRYTQLVNSVANVKNYLAKLF